MAFLTQHLFQKVTEKNSPKTWGNKALNILNSLLDTHTQTHAFLARKDAS